MCSHSECMTEIYIATVLRRKANSRDRQFTLHIPDKPISAGQEETLLSLKLKNGCGQIYI